MGLALDTHAVTISLGGTNTWVCAANLRGKILDTHKLNTADLHAPEETVAALKAVAIDFRTRYAAEVLGIAIGGPFDPDSGEVGTSSALPGWKGKNVYSLFVGQYGFDSAHIFAEHDGKAMALFQHYFGAAFDTDNFIALTFGTGMGGGSLEDGRMKRGRRNNAGEVGHIPVRSEPGFENLVTFEDFCCGPGIVRVLHRALDVLPNLTTSLDAAADPTKIFEAYDRGDLLALEVVRVVREALAWGVAALCTDHSPDKVVIGAIYARHAAAFNLLETKAFKLLQERNPLALETVVVPAKREQDTSPLQPAAVIRFAGSGYKLDGELRLQPDEIDKLARV